MKRTLVDRLLALQKNRKCAALVTDLQSGAQSLVDANDRIGDLALAPDVVERVLAAVRSGQSGIESQSGYFVHVYQPSLRLIVVGAVHIGQSLAAMADLSGYKVYVVDPRRTWATAERFPGVELLTVWPDQALSDCGLDSRTAVVTLTHDPKFDDPALCEALTSEAFYIGALGSKRTHASRLKRLKEMGWNEMALRRIHGPVGLAIGAKSPAEISVSILAEMTRALHEGAP